MKIAQYTLHESYGNVWDRQALDQIFRESARVRCTPPSPYCSSQTSAKSVNQFWKYVPTNQSHVEEAVVIRFFLLIDQEESRLDDLFHSLIDTGFQESLAQGVVGIQIVTVRRDNIHCKCLLTAAGSFTDLGR